MRILKALRRRPAARVIPMSADDLQLLDELRRRRNERAETEVQS
jgi:hypothetical protein